MEMSLFDHKRPCEKFLSDEKEKFIQTTNPKEKQNSWFFSDLKMSQDDINKKNKDSNTILVEDQSHCQDNIKFSTNTTYADDSSINNDKLLKNTSSGKSASIDYIDSKVNENGEIFGKIDHCHDDPHVDNNPTKIDKSIKDFHSQSVLMTLSTESCCKNEKCIQLFYLAQDLIEFCEAIDDSRRKLIDEKNRLRNINGEITQMLKQSNEREQNNFSQIDAQRKFLLRQQKDFESLKKHAERAVVELSEQRDLLKKKLEDTDSKLKEIIIENGRFQLIQDSQKQELQNVEAIKESYSFVLKERESLQSEVENLTFENSKLQNEKSSLQSEVTRLQNQLDLLEVERKQLSSFNLPSSFELFTTGRLRHSTSLKLSENDTLLPNSDC